MKVSEIKIGDLGHGGIEDADGQWRTQWIGADVVLEFGGVGISDHPTCRVTATIPFDPKMTVPQIKDALIKQAKEALQDALSGIDEAWEKDPFRRGSLSN